MTNRSITLDLPEEPTATPWDFAMALGMCAANLAVSGDGSSAAIVLRFQQIAFAAHAHANPPVSESFSRHLEGGK